MTMRITLAAAALVTLAACGRPATTTAPTPEPSASAPAANAAHYRAASTIHDASGRTLNLVMYVDGPKMRMETGDVVTIVNNETHEAFLISDVGGRQMAMRAPANTTQQLPGADWLSSATEGMTRSGTCSLAGETGTEWSKTKSDGTVETGCVTSDGILLRAKQNDRVVWETTSVERGPQAATLFELPAGAQAMDLGALAADAMAKAKARDGD